MQRGYFRHCLTPRLPPTSFGLFSTSQDMTLLSLSPKRIGMFDVLPVSRKWAFMSKGCVFLCRNVKYIGRRGVHCLTPSAHAGCWEVLGLDFAPCRVGTRKAGLPPLLTFLPLSVFRADSNIQASFSLSG